MARKSIWQTIKESLVSTKDVINVGSLSMYENDRGSVHKSSSPDFFFKSPFGIPRGTDLLELRRLARSPYVYTAITAVIDRVASTPYDITPSEQDTDLTPELEAQIKHVQALFDNPNTNAESFEELLRKITADILEIDSGVLVKVFNQQGVLCELYARDGATFTKNPDVYGRYIDREEVMLESEIVGNNKQEVQRGQIRQVDARDKAAYFQFNWTVQNSQPVPFGWKEIVWFERNPRSDNVYGRSPVEILADTIQLLIYGVQHNLDYYADNNVPKGVLGLPDASDADLDAFDDMWNERMRKRDVAGKWHKRFHHVPMINKIPKFERLEFSNAELELLEQQKWFAPLVWSCFGTTPSELGITEDAKGMANQIVQSKVFRDRAINPILRLLEYKINTQVIKEFGYENVKFKFLIDDIDDEMRKVGLYEKQISTGLRTINEIRVAEGLDEVEWGDEPPSSMRAPVTNFNMSNEPRREDGQELREQENLEAEGKALEGSSPLFPKEGELMTPTKLTRAVRETLTHTEKQIIAVLNGLGKDAIKNLKGVREVIDRIKSFLSFEGLRRVSNELIKDEFMKGWESTESKLNRNLQPNQEALSYIQEYTFDNIKEMTEEIGNDLRQELQRGFMNGESIPQLITRVKNVMRTGDNRAEMIARTESNRAENYGKLTAIKSSGERAKKYLLVTQDNRTSKISKALDAKYGSPEKAIPINDNFSVIVDGKSYEGQAPPFHVNERDVLIIVPE